MNTWFGCQGGGHSQNHNVLIGQGFEVLVLGKDLVLACSTLGEAIETVSYNTINSQI